MGRDAGTAAFGQDAAVWVWVRGRERRRSTFDASTEPVHAQGAESGPASPLQTDRATKTECSAAAVAWTGVTSRPTPDNTAASTQEPVRRGHFRQRHAAPDHGHAGHQQEPRAPKRCRAAKLVRHAWTARVFEFWARRPELSALGGIVHVFLQAPAHRPARADKGPVAHFLVCETRFGRAARKCKAEKADRAVGRDRQAPL